MALAGTFFVAHDMAVSAASAVKQAAAHREKWSNFIIFSLLFPLMHCARDEGRRELGNR